MSRCRSLPSALVLASLAAWPLSGAAAEADWRLIQEKDGISSYLRSVEGESVHAARGVTTVDLPACQLISFYVADELATSWVDMLVDVKVVELAPRRSLVWQHFDLPWPVTDREFLVEIAVERPDDRTILVTLESTTDPRFPPPADTDTMVRGRMTASTWTFTQEAPGRTRVDMVGQVDPGGKIPTWLINLVQHSFPYNTLSAFVRGASKATVPLRPECADW